MSTKTVSCQKTTPQVRKAWGITRVSTERQNFGIQDTKIHIYLEQHPELEYQDTYKIKQSAYTLTPKQSKKIINALPNHSALIFSKVDRLTRNIDDFSKFKEIIAKKDLEIHFIQEKLVWNYTTNRDTEHKILDYISAAEYYSIDLSKKVKDGNYVKRQSGEITYSAPLGYQNYSEGREKGWKIDPKTGPIVKELFEFYSTGRFSFSQLADYAYRKGLTGRITKNSGTYKKLTKQAVANILSNKFYIGLASFNGETYEHKYEKLIPNDLFEKCQSVHKSKFHIKSPFKKAIISAFCGLIRESETNKLYSPYLQKGKIYLKAPAPGYKDLKEKNFYKCLIKVLGKLSNNSNLSKFLEEHFNKSTNMDYELLVSELNTLTTEVQTYQKRIEDLLINTRPNAKQEQIDNAIRTLNQRIDDLTIRIQEAKSKLDSTSMKNFNFQGNLASKYQDLCLQKQHEFLAQLFSGVQYKNGLITFLLSDQAQEIVHQKQFIFNYAQV